MDKKITNYKIQKEGYEQIDKALKDLLELCQIYHLPAFACVATENDDKETKYNAIVYSAQSHQINLKNDKIRKCMLIANGFEAVPARESFSMDMDEMGSFFITES